MTLIYYDAKNIFRPQNLPGMGLFQVFFRAYGNWVTPIDRSGTIRLPIRVRSLFPLPAFATFTKSYEWLCNERALELLEHADRLDVPLYTFWSGGIDSTCVLVSLLKHATPAQRERIAVLMSEASISEYPEFYYRYIRGKLRCVPAGQFPYLIGTKNLIVNGEHNDQLFGSDIIAYAIKAFGFDAVMASYNRELFIDFFADKMADRIAATWYVDLFERLKDRALVPLKTNFDLFWWINFTLKWQNVFMRMLSFMAPRNVLTADYVRDYYKPFYGTDDFQLWSMNNLDKRVRGSWRGYKWPVKDIIFDFTKDAEYRDNKMKLGSLQFLVMQRAPARFIDDDYRFYESLAQDVFYEEHNDFGTQTPACRTGMGIRRAPASSRPGRVVGDACAEWHGFTRH